MSRVHMPAAETVKRLSPCHLFNNINWYSRNSLNIWYLLSSTGLNVRAFVRDAAKLPENLKNQVEVFVGNVLEPDSVSDAVEGMDGVVIALGTNNCLDPTSDMSEGTKNIIDAMRAKNVKNISACLSAFLFYEPDKVPPRFVNLNEDHKRMYDALSESPLNYVAVFPPHIASKCVFIINSCTLYINKYLSYMS